MKQQGMLYIASMLAKEEEKKEEEETNNDQGMPLCPVSITVVFHTYVTFCFKTFRLVRIGFPREDDCASNAQVDNIKRTCCERK